MKFVVQTLLSFTCVGEFGCWLIQGRKGEGSGSWHLLCRKDSIFLTTVWSFMRRRWTTGVFVPLLRLSLFAISSLEGLQSGGLFSYFFLRVAFLLLLMSFIAIAFRDFCMWSSHLYSNIGNLYRSCVWGWQHLFVSFTAYIGEQIIVLPSYILKGNLITRSFFH